jgi:hypothetical protein
MPKPGIFARSASLFSIAGFLVLIGFFVVGRAGVAHAALGTLILAGGSLVALGAVLSINQQRRNSR